MPIEWKLVGKNILTDDNTAQELASIADSIQPPALTTNELNRLYEWADVLLLPSYWEGLPLTILEAMRLGVVVCASNVGAIAEVVQHQQDGLIIKNEQKGLFVQEAIDLLQDLISDRNKLIQLSKSAVLKASDVIGITLV